MGASGEVSATDVEAAWKQYNGKCWVCGDNADELDHYRPLNKTGGGNNTADNIRPICGECNHKRHRAWINDEIAQKEAVMLKALKRLFMVADTVRRDVSNSGGNENE